MTLNECSHYHPTLSEFFIIVIIISIMGSNPAQAWFFVRPYFLYFLSNVHYCVDHVHIHPLICTLHFRLHIFAVINITIIIIFTLPTLPVDVVRLNCIGLYSLGTYRR